MLLRLPLGPARLRVSRTTLPALLCLQLASIALPVAARDIAQIADDDRSSRRLSDDATQVTTRDRSTGVTFTVTAAAAARFKNNVYETKRDRIGSVYFDPEALLFARRPFDFDPRFRLGLGAYANQQIYTHRSARDAGYTLLRAIMEADFQDRRWRVALRYAAGLTMEPDGSLIDYTAHDFRLRAGRSFDAGWLIGGAADALTLTPQITLLRRDASRASKSKSEAVASLLWDHRIADGWILEGEVSATFTRYDRVDDFRERDLALRIEPRVTYAPRDANYALGVMVGLGRRFSNISDFDAFYWEAGPGAEAKATLRWRF